jgi:hypothetical protein
MSGIQNLKKENTVQKPVVPFLKFGEAPTQLTLLEKPPSFETDSSSFYCIQISTFPQFFTFISSLCSLCNVIQ